MTVIFTLSMLAYGLKRGGVPAIRWFLVFAFSFAVALTFRDAFAPVLSGVFRRMEWDWVEALSYIILQTVTFIVLTIPMLMYSEETVPVHKHVDRLVGAVFGTAAGISMGGLFVLTVMAMPSGRRVFTGRTEWYVPPHRLMLRAYGFLSRSSLGGDRKFVEDVVIRDLEKGRPSMPTGGDKLWVSSVPVGLRVYIVQGYRSRNPSVWKRELENSLYRIESRWRQTGTGRRRKRAEGYIGRTPVAVEIETPELMVAVEMPVPESGRDKVPFDGKTMPFYWDGEQAWFTQTVFKQPVVVKIYGIKGNLPGQLVTLVASFLPRDLAPDDRQDWYERRLPGRNCYQTFIQSQAAVDRLLGVATSRDVDEHYLPWLLRGGKAVVEDPNTGEITAFEVQPDKSLKEWRRPAAAPNMPPLE